MYSLVLVGALALINNNFHLATFIFKGISFYLIYSAYLKWSMLSFTFLFITKDLISVSSFNPFGKNKIATIMDLLPLDF